MKEITNVPIVSEDLPYSEDRKEGVDELYESIHVDKQGSLCREMYEQMKRIGSCFKHINVKIIIERETIFCELRADFTLQWFKDLDAENLKFNWYIVIPIEIIGEKQTDFISYLNEVQNKFITILMHAHSQHIKVLDKLKLSAFIKDKVFCARRDRESLTKAHVRLVRVLGDLVEKKKVLLSKKKTCARENQHPLIEGDLMLARVSLDRQLEEINTDIMNALNNIQHNVNALNRIYLETDFLFYTFTHAAIALNRDER